ncbi:MAG: beta-galactosidase trimerization domain-containing protein, partial [Actinomyces sp.]|nr:beta-galactosidase trimerization domain-containing protein [Actinomyces sp.]
GIAVDVVGAEADLEGYSLVVVAGLFMDRPELASELERVAADGAQVLVTGPTGVVGAHMEAVLGGYLGSFRELLGVRVVDHAALPGPVGAPVDARSALVDRLTRVVGAPGSGTWIGLSAQSPWLTRALERIATPTPDLRAGMWAEVLAPLEEVSEQGDPGDLPLAGVEVVATFDGRGGGVDLSGLPAITHRTVTAAPEVGSAEEEPERPGTAGGAWYVACDLDAPSRAALVQVLAAHARVRPVVDGLPDGVEAQRRGDILFLLNHGDRAAEVSGVVGTDLVSGAQCTGHVVLAPRSGMVVRE